MNNFTLSDETGSCLLKLNTILCGMDSAAIAFSGGTDSTLLVEAASRIKKIRVLAVTVKSILVPAAETESAVEFISGRGIKHILLDADILSENDILANSPERCYHCKKFIFTRIIEAAAAEGITHILEGTHHDDLSDYRPGLKAIAELGVLSPLKEAGFRKQNIRELARYFGLANWNTPAYPCLATRIPFGTGLRKEDLRRVEEAEKFLHRKGFTRVRVRVHGGVARIEVAPDMIPQIADGTVRNEISDYIKLLGFDFVTLDLDGYRTGSMNLNK